MDRNFKGGPRIMPPTPVTRRPRSTESAQPKVENQLAALAEIEIRELADQLAWCISEIECRARVEDMELEEWRLLDDCRRSVGQHEGSSERAVENWQRRHEMPVDQRP
jgi:hypothetical protein